MFLFKTKSPMHIYTKPFQVSVLVFGWDSFFIVAGMVLCFGVITKIMLITNQFLARNGLGSDTAASPDPN